MDGRIQRKKEKITEWETMKEKNKGVIWMLENLWERVKQETY